MGDALKYLSFLYCFELGLLQEFDALEFFAGQGNLTRYFRMCDLRTGSLDLLYKDRMKNKKKRKSNCYDLLSASGFAFLSPKNMFVFCEEGGC